MTSTADRIKSGVRQTFDNAAATFDEGGFGFFAHFGERLVEVADLAAGDTVLDVGCGSGAVSLPAAARVGRDGRVVAIDLSENMVAALDQRIAREGLANIRAVVRDGENPQLGDERFDVVVAGFSIMHFPNAPASLAVYRDLLRPGGRLCFSELVDVDGLPGLVPSDVFALLQPHFPRRDEDPRERGLSSWSDSAASIRTALHEIGFSGIDVLEQEQTIEVRSSDEWLSWAMSTGLRVAWDTQEKQAADDLTSRVRTQLDRHRVAGLIRFPLCVRYVQARLGPGHLSPSTPAQTTVHGQPDSCGGATPTPGQAAPSKGEI